MGAAPSGEQFEISFARQRATVVEVGGGVRTYTAEGRDVLEPYGVDEICDGAHGAVLIPWPNRLDGGSYEFDGSTQQLPLTEPATRTAIHGLLRWQPWRALEHDAERVVMGARLHPQPGYPFDLDVSVEYSLGEDGLIVVTSARNVGDRPCPYGAGQHPYLSPGQARLDDCTLQLPAETVILTDPERKLPTGSEPVGGGRMDFREPRRIEATAIDSAFTDLRRGADHLATVRLTAPAGDCVELWVDERYQVLELFTGETLAPRRRRRGLAVEPMTCPPNAFRSGERLIRLDPGESVRSTWGARLLG
ncbi:MAG: aldose 1-epimerase [Solirubrobacteraceae bacterium]|jgi:aldose 1-epimerase|nr:aldose epimerase [Solirubrobacterales bacterium]MEA2214453.1 aldose 1-epimerase [Solirubrobacteraceae bacterium]